MKAGKGFAWLLDRIESNGVRTVSLEDASRFARELVVQELGIALLDKRSARLLTASGDEGDRTTWVRPAVGCPAAR